MYPSSNQYIDDEVIETLETEELIEIIVDNELWYINLFSTQEMGIDKFKINNEYYKELITRENINENLELIIFEESNLDRKNDFIFLQQIINEATNNGNILNVAGYYDDIYTPNGSVVEHAYYSINYIKSADIIRCHNQIIEEFPNLAN